jgi:hypothetical protein
MQTNSQQIKQLRTDVRFALAQAEALTMAKPSLASEWLQLARTDATKASLLAQAAKRHHDRDARSALSTYAQIEVELNGAIARLTLA